MKDQVDALKKLNVKAAQIDSSLSFEEVKKVKDSLDDGRYIIGIFFLS